MSLKETLIAIFNLIQWFLGIKISSDNIYWENVVEVVIIIVIAYFIIPIFFQITDSMMKSFNVTGLNAWVLGGFKTSLLFSTIHLILLGLFGGIKNLLFKFHRVIFAGLSVGLLLTFSLVTLEKMLSMFAGTNTLLIYVYSIYPLLISFIIRLQISHDIRQ